MTKDRVWLYMDTGDFQVYKNPTGDYEGFTPSLDIEEGWIVYFSLSHYDSGGEQPGISWEVLDLYKTEEEAEKNAKKILRFQGKLEGPVRADGSKPYMTWDAWGNSLEGVYISPVKVQERKEGGRRRIY